MTTDHLTADLRAATALADTANDNTGKRAWETCPSCKGSGLGLNMAGEPDHCFECKGETVVRARDDHGRFIGNPERQTS